MEADFNTAFGGELLNLINNTTAAIGVSQMHAENFQTLVLEYLDHRFTTVNGYQLIKKCFSLQILGAVSAR